MLIPVCSVKKKREVSGPVGGVFQAPHLLAVVGLLVRVDLRLLVDRPAREAMRLHLRRDEARPRAPASPPPGASELSGASGSQASFCPSTACPQDKSGRRLASPALPRRGRRGRWGCPLPPRPAAREQSPFAGDLHHVVDVVPDGADRNLARAPTDRDGERFEVLAWRSPASTPGSSPSQARFASLANADPYSRDR